MLSRILKRFGRSWWAWTMIAAGVASPPAASCNLSALLTAHFTTCPDAGLRFMWHGAAGSVFFATDGVIFATSEGLRARMKPVAPDGGMLLEGSGNLGGRSHYFLGDRPSAWKADLEQYAAVRYRNVWPGIDLVFRAADGTIEYDWIVAPGADPKTIRYVYQGVGHVRIEADGGLRLTAGGMEMRNLAPRVYQLVGGERRLVSGHFRLTENAQVGFIVGDYDRGMPLVIDPVISFSMGLPGGPGSPTLWPGLGEGVAVDGDGNIYVTGRTSDPCFPTVNPLQPWLAGGSDVFVLKVDPTASRVLYSTFLGGSGFDAGLAIAVDEDGSAYVTGVAACEQGFPRTPIPRLGSGGGAGEAFVTKLSPDGSMLQYSNCLGGSGDDIGKTIAIDSTGKAYVAGTTTSPDFPVTLRAAQTSHGGATDTFVRSRCERFRAGILHATGWEPRRHGRSTRYRRRRSGNRCRVHILHRLPYDPRSPAKRPPGPR